MSLDTEKQFAGNYIRLVNQCRDLQADIVVKDKMIELMSNDLHNTYYDDSAITVMMKYKLDAQKQLVVEQNKKAASGESI